MGKSPYSVVFRAVSTSAELIIGDELPDISARQYFERPFAPANVNQQHVLFNFVQVQEFLPRKTGNQQNFIHSKGHTVHVIGGSGFSLKIPIVR
jgi:hypothetical protein